MTIILHMPSLTLQKINCIKKTEIYNISNIRENYTVTDKADGLRKLLFINGVSVYGSNR